MTRKEKAVLIESIQADILKSDRERDERGRVIIRDAIKRGFSCDDLPVKQNG